jgi:chromosome segregation ATPase
MNDALAEDFMAPLREAQARLAQLRDEITNKRRELAALESECAVARKAMNELGAQRVELQSAVNGARAELTRTQNAHASLKGAYDELKKQVASLPLKRVG